MADTTVSLFPVFLAPEGFGPGIPGQSTTDVGVLEVEVEEISSILVTEELVVEQVEVDPVEVTEYIEIEVATCD